MKALAFEIAQKIASDRSSHTFFACASVLKEAFKIEGYSDKVANSMAIDGIKVIVATMIRMAK